MSAEIVTFGCRLNAYESEVMRAHAAGLEDTIIFNPCAVTAEAVRQARQRIRKLDEDRLLTDPVLAQEPGEDDLAAARSLLEKHSPETIAAALARLYRSRLPAPEDVFDPGFLARLLAGVRGAIGVGDGASDNPTLSLYLQDTN